MRRLFVCLSVVGFCVSAGLADGRTLQTVSTPKLAVPTKIAKLAPDGTVTGWVAYGTRADCDHVLVFDCFEPDEDGWPTGFNTCGYEDGSNNELGGHRWYFGPTYRNPYVTNDMEFDPNCGGMYVSRLEVAWYWYVNGPGTGENCAIVVETFEDFDDTCDTGDPNGQGASLGGVVLLFGYMNGDSGPYYNYWFADVDLCGQEQMQLPTDGAGSYNIWLLTYEGDDPNWPDDFSLATCAQAMLWGTGTGEWINFDCIGRGKGNCPGGQPPDGETSHHGLIQWDDDDPTDGWHTPNECYDYAYHCPDPLGAMLCFYVDGPCPPDCDGDIDGDGDTDQADLGELLRAWDSEPGYPNWNEDADLDNDGHIGHGDLGILLADWGCGT
jgi:hypothetical protein